MPTIYHWNQPLVVDQDRYNNLITRYGYFAVSTMNPNNLDKDLADQTLSLNRVYTPTMKRLAPTSYRARLGARRTSRCNIVVIGDSITAGQGATAYDKRWISLANVALRKRMNQSELGGAGYIGGFSNGVNSFTWPCAVAGSPANNQSYGPSFSAATMSSTSHKFTYAAVKGTAVDIMMNDANAAVITSKIDANATVDQTVTGLNVDGKKIRVTLGASGTYAFEIAWKSGSTVYVDGIVVYDGDENAGITIHDGGHYGFKTTDFVAQTGTIGRWPSAINSLDPAVVVFALGANDLLTNTVDQFIDSLNTLMSRITAKMGSATPPFVIMMLGARDTYLIKHQQFVQAAQTLANNTANISFLDLSAAFPNYNDSDYFGAYADGVHPSDKGHAMIADLFVNYFAL